MTNLNSVGELHEVAEYEMLLIQARTMDPHDVKACESFIEKVDWAFTCDRISSGMAQRIVSVLSERKRSPRR